jgi:Xaa-Pro aminopeptidase
MADRILPFQSDFAAAEFANRRERVMQAIGSDAVALLQGAPPTGGAEVFRQWNDFYYLTGIETPHAYLLIDGVERTSTLYLPPRDERLEKSDGPLPSCEDVDFVCEKTGVQRVRPREDMKQDLPAGAVVYAPLGPPEGSRMSRDTLQHARRMVEQDPWSNTIPPELQFQATVQSWIAPGEVRDLTPALDALRVVKSEAELALMRRAGQLTAAAVTEAMRSTRPGVMEFHLAAIAEYTFSAGGAQGSGYRPIVAGGRNIPNAHYFRNDQPLGDGDLVLMDYAPDVGYYTSDIGRMWPVNGRYAPWQRELYGFMVEYHKVLLGLIRPGVTARQILDEGAQQMSPTIESMSWSRPSFLEAARNTLKYPGHLSHGVGMAVHDAGDYRAKPLEPGVVFALDPQLWSPEDDLYIRVEDTVVVTADGCENLTAAAPLELDDVEEMMTDPGLLETFPPI